MADRLSVSGLPRAGAPRAARGRWVLERALTRPSLPALVALALVVAFFALKAPELLSARGLAGVVDVAATLGIGGVAVALLLVAGQFDLSVGVLAMSSAAVTALLVGHAGWGMWPALLASLACALLVGVVNGVLVVNTGLPSFLVTLATFLVLQGTTLAGVRAIAGSGRISGLDDAPGWSSAATLFGSTAQLGDGRFRVSLLWWPGVTAVATWVLWRTKFGNAVFASGGARTAARELGVPVRRTTVALFCLSATAGWLIGTLGLVRFAAVQVGSAGLATGIDFIVVAVLGGCLLAGGYGSALGASIGALLYAVVRQGITLAGWDPPWFQALLGVLLVVALVANAVVGHRLKGVPRS
ncbi:monosaccharide ABC transporter membrane protein, CUT2 family [Blastococcus aggregatus]|uniref:Xylose transport system permease protein XylH n=1 Tax=Blastococcus aggregatus TaxID=38502 RepID=A0A285VEN7_9ACTN|nr:ABC transporter permease [Blastococcus aggregatus]SOC51566.1 monosaccharide ABC transporter membrane protein, CUT2 family [Blastococcus aggregatus]